VVPVDQDRLNLILDCYELAKYYGCSPEVFLAMPLSESHLHLIRTVQLCERQELVRRRAKDDD
jgi:hypothetical protein